MDDAEKLARNFFMPIESTFEIAGYVVVTGQITYGEINVGNPVNVYKSNIAYEATILSVEMFRKLFDRAEFGDNVGLLLKGVTKKQIENADYIIRADENQSDVYFDRCLKCGCWTAGKIEDPLFLKAIRTAVKNPGKIVGGALNFAIPGAVAIGSAVDGIFKEQLDGTAKSLAGDVCYECPQCSYIWQFTKENAEEYSNAYFGEDDLTKEIDNTLTEELFNNLTYVNITEAEESYLETLKECLEKDNEISSRERKILEKLRIRLNISESRAKELEESFSFSSPQLTEEEQEYLEEYRTCLEEDEEISPKERRLLDKLRVSLGISKERAKELESITFRSKQ